MKYKRFIKGRLLRLQSFFKSWKKVVSLIIVLLISLILLVIILHAWVANSYSNKKYESVEDVPEDKVAIIFGAGLREKDPTPVLRDRVKVGVELYNAGKVQKLIMSGDNRTEYHDEPTAMKNLAMDEGVPEHAIQPDYAGRRTYDTCLRAKKIFKLESAILVTQSFHMDRALYTCNSLGIDSVGVTADLEDYEGQTWWKVRDYFALVRAIWDLNVDKPDDVVLGDVIEL